VHISVSPQIQPFGYFYSLLIEIIAEAPHLVDSWRMQPISLRVQGCLHHQQYLSAVPSSNQTSFALRVIDGLIKLNICEMVTISN
jgi:hypothetical protein